jgi:hypothetical protein
MENKTDIRVELEGEISEKFLRLKEKFGLKNNTEVIRRVITEAYDRLIPEKAEAVPA